VIEIFRNTLYRNYGSGVASGVGLGSGVGDSDGAGVVSGDASGVGSAVFSPSPNVETRHLNKKKFINTVVPNEDIETAVFCFNKMPFFH